MTDEEEIESLEEDLNYMSGEMNEIKSKIAAIKLRIAKNAAQQRSIMNDSNFIEEIARKWVELGGDSEGVAWSWKRLQEAVINIEYAQQSVQLTAAVITIASGLHASGVIRRRRH